MSQNYFILFSAAYASPYGAPIVKTAIAHHPISTSYANTYKVASAYPAYGAYNGAYHAPLAGAYHAPIASAIHAPGYGAYGAYGAYGSALHAPIAAPIIKSAYPAYGAGYAAYGGAYHH